MHGSLGMTPPLRRNRDFVLLQTGMLLSATGSNVSRIAYPLLVLAVTGSAAKAGLVGTAEIVPLAALGLAAGVVADRVDRRRIMVVSDVVGALALGGLGAAVLVDHVRFWQVVAVAFVDGTAGVFYNAGQSGAFRAVVPREQLPLAASVAMGRASTVRLASPPLGGALFGLAQAVPFLADALSYGFSTLALLLMRTPFQETRERDRTPATRQLVEGVRHLWSMPFLRTTALMIGVENFALSGAQLAVIVLAKRHGLSSAAVGGLVALVGATTLLGSLASPLLRRLLSMRAILLSEFWVGLGTFSFLVWPNVYVLAATLAAQAFCFPNTDSAVMAYRYALTPDRLTARVVTASQNVAVLTMPLGPLAAGLLLGATSPRVTIAIFSCSVLAVAIWGTLSRAIRDLPPLSEVVTSSASPAEAG